MGLVAFMFGLTGRQRLPSTVLLRLLNDLGLSAAASRALLSRMGRQGQVTSHRRHRKVDYALSGEFASSFERVRVQAMTRPGEWSGHFHAILYAVPEAQRTFRDALRRAAVLAGYGLLHQGVLISFVDRRRQLAEVLSSRPEDAQVWLTTMGMSAEDAAAAAGLAWDLPELAGRYRAHIDRISARLADQRSRDGSTRGSGAGSAASVGVPALRDYVEVLLPALEDTLREPGVPIELLPSDWPGPELRRSFDDFRTAFAPVVESYVSSLFEQHASAIGA